jgi:hypothetical protein
MSDAKFKEFFQCCDIYDFREWWGSMTDAPVEMAIIPGRVKWSAKPCPKSGIHTIYPTNLLSIRLLDGRGADILSLICSHVGPAFFFHAGSLHVRLLPELFLQRAFIEQARSS